MKKLIDKLPSDMYDEKFTTNRKHYILQCLLIFVCISILLLLYNLFGGIIVASLGASSFIVLITPHTRKAAARYVIGGYICGALSGVLFGWLYNTLPLMELFGETNNLIILAAAAAATATFIMIVFNFEHPPAAALALGLTVEPQFIKTALAAIAGVVIICIIRRILRKQLMDLI